MNKTLVRKKYLELIKQVNNDPYYTSMDMTNKVNCYICHKCSNITKTIDIDRGVTPSKHRCERCNELGSSTFYNDYYDFLVPTQEWYRPSLDELLNMPQHTIDFVLMGGLVNRLISEEKIQQAKRKLVTKHITFLDQVFGKVRGNKKGMDFFFSSKNGPNSQRPKSILDFILNDNFLQNSLEEIGKEGFYKNNFNESDKNKNHTKPNKLCPCGNCYNTVAERDAGMKKRSEAIKNELLKNLYEEPAEKPAEEKPMPNITMANIEEILGRFLENATSGYFNIIEIRSLYNSMKDQKKSL